MCGIFGFAGPGGSRNALVRLAMLNTSRGRDSLGFAGVLDTFRGNAVNVWKRAGDPFRLMRRRKSGFGEFMREHGKAWAMLGHTRFATQGAIVDRNAHPLACGRYIGTHNGHIDAPKTCEVDSQHLWDRLYAADGDYQSAWGEQGGSFALAWTNGDSVWLLRHGSPLSIVQHRGAWYWSSESVHLTLALGPKVRPVRLEDDECVRIDPDGTLTVLPPLAWRDTSWDALTLLDGPDDGCPAWEPGTVWRDDELRHMPLDDDWRRGGDDDFGRYYGAE